jgi:hypothetical protein
VERKQFTLRLEEETFLDKALIEALEKRGASRTTSLTGPDGRQCCYPS